VTPHLRDTDPLHVEPDDLWDPQAKAWVPRQSHLPAVLAGVAYGVAIGFLAGLLFATHVLAAVGPAPEVVVPASSPGPTGAPLGPVARSSSATGARVTPGPDGGAPPLRQQHKSFMPATHTIRGVASWYGASDLIAAAGPALRIGDWRGRLITVTAGGRSIVVRLSDWCLCRTRAIDLSDDAFAHLAPLSQGLVDVRVSW